MRLKLALALLAGLLIAVPVYAQTTTTTTTTTTEQGTTGQTTTTEPPPAPAPAVADADARDLDEMTNEFIVSGFVGGSFARNSAKTSVDFGGAFDYLRNGAFGAEFLAGFAPRFKLDRLGGTDSDVNNYMANVIAAVPVGSYQGIRPFVSAGIGALTLSQNTNSSSNTAVNAANALFEPSETHFGGNIGAGIMGFTGAFGVRADVRYFSSLGHKSGNSPAVTQPGTLQSVLDDVSFWRANVGLAFRF